MSILIKGIHFWFVAATQFVQRKYTQLYLRWSFPMHFIPGLPGTYGHRYRPRPNRQHRIALRDLCGLMTPLFFIATRTGHPKIVDDRTWMQWGFFYRWKPRGYRYSFIKERTRRWWWQEFSAKSEDPSVET